MAVMNLLRIFADLGFYYAFAGTVSWHFGGRLSFPALLVLGVCYAACFRLRERKKRQYLVLAAAALALLLPVAWADRIGYLPALGYLVYLVRRGDYDLSRTRQVELFEIFGRAFALFSFLWCALMAIFSPAEDFSILLDATRDYLAAGVPMAVFGSAASVLLMRSIRHEPAVYLWPGFQAVNIAIAGAVLLFSGAVSSPPAVRAMVWTYRNVLTPLLIACFMVVGMILVCLYPLLQLIVAFFLRQSTAEAMEELVARLDEFFAYLRQLLGIPPYEIIIQAGGTVLTLASLALAVFLVRGLLRWLVRRWRERMGAADPLHARALPAGAAGEAKPRSRRAQNDVERVRRQYRVFLRLCQKHGVNIGRSSTSGEISDKAAEIFGPEAPLADIHNIYREARYYGSASRAGASRLRKLCDQVRKRRMQK